MIVSTLITLLVIYISLNLTHAWLRNRRAHQFFKKNSPQLPVVPDVTILGGHVRNLVVNEHSLLIVDKWHRELGETFGFFEIDKPWVSTTDLDLIKLVEVDEAHKHRNRLYYGSPFHYFNQSIWQNQDDTWSRVRRVVGGALTNRRVQGPEIAPDIDRIADKFCRCLSESLGETATGVLEVNVHDIAERFTLAVIFATTYKRDDVIDFKGPTDKWVERIKSGYTHLTDWPIILGFMFPLVRPLIARLIEFHSTGITQRTLVDYIRQATDKSRLRSEESQVKAARQVPSKRRLVDGIFDGVVEKKMSYGEYLGTVFFLQLAGYETTAITITTLVWQLAMNPELQEKLRAEIVREGSECDYLTWCIMEAIRYHPPVSFGTGRVLTEDVKSPKSGLLIPKGSFLVPSTFSVHHDPKVWPDPWRFWPERWSVENSQGRHPIAFMGFGLGPRNCVGKALALHELRTVFDKLLRQFRFEKNPNTFDEFEFISPGMVFTILTKPLKVDIIPIKVEG